MTDLLRNSPMALFTCLRCSPLLLALILLACETKAKDPQTASFVNRIQTSGIDFLHRPFRTSHKHLPEINSGCVALLDYNQDGRLDVFLGQGTPLSGSEERSTADSSNRLYRNEGSWCFSDVTEDAGLQTPDYTFHVSAPDFDGDGDQDLYLCNLNKNRWYRNDEGHFVEVTDEVGAGSDRWSSAAAFADFDQDGDLDLYVANYCQYSFDHAGCQQVLNGERIRSYCSPDEFAGEWDQFFRLDGMRYVEATAEAGLAAANGTALGLAISDFDNDGAVDLFVANDGRPNHLWHNEGNLRFHDVAPEVGVDVASSGLSEACMGADFADIDHDGDFDLLVANLAMETNTFYQNEGTLFLDKSIVSGLGPPSLRSVGFGCEFFDFDNDMDADAVVVNGHVLDNVHLIEPSQTFAQRGHVYVNQGNGRFAERGEELGPYFSEQHVSRGLAVGDLDNDGDLDLIVAHNGEIPSLLENRLGDRNSWIGFRLVGADRNTFAIGARVTVSAGSITQMEEVRGTSSYGAFQDLRIHFGLGDHSQIDQVTVRWPTGQVSQWGPLPARRYHTLEQAKP